jgi:hypothetical protein
MSNVRLLLPSFLLAASLITPRLFAAEPQPAMHNALQHMRQAQAALEKAEHDKGGHRVKALEHLKAAIAETEAGIQFDNTHRSKAEEMREKKH